MPPPLFYESPYKPPSIMGWYSNKVGIACAGWWLFKRPPAPVPAIVLMANVGFQDHGWLHRSVISPKISALQPGDVCQCPTACQQLYNYYQSDYLEELQIQGRRFPILPGLPGEGLDFDKTSWRHAHRATPTPPPMDESFHFTCHLPRHHVITNLLASL